MIVDSKEQKELLLNLVRGATVSGNKETVKKILAALDGLEEAVQQANVAEE